MSIGEFVYRHAGGCLIETPDFEPRRPSDVENWTWTATLWRDHRQPDGWAVLEWQPGERGWLLPATTAIGDVIEFGSGTIDSSGVSRFDRWWGWIKRISPRALVVIGQFDHPMHAEHDAQTTIDEVRLSQLDAPDIVDAVAATLGTDPLD